MRASSLVLHQDACPKMARKPRAAVARNVPPSPIRKDCAGSAQIVPFRNARAHEIDTFDYQRTYGGVDQAIADGVWRGFIDYSAPSEWSGIGANYT